MSTNDERPSTDYRVKWHATPGRDFESSVTIIEGYSTLADIPKIIAVARTGNPADAAVITIDQITRLDSTR